jgi:hypothetical protein
LAPGITLIVNWLDTAGEPIEQMASEVIRTLITSPFTRTDVEYTEPVAPEIGSDPLYH